MSDSPPPVSAEEIKALPEDLAQMRLTGVVSDCDCDECVRFKKARDLAIRIITIVAGNPRGFSNWAKIHGFEI